MDVSHAANYFNTVALAGWKHDVTGDPWVRTNLPEGKLSVSGRDQTFGNASNWRTLLTNSPLNYLAIRYGNLETSPIYLLGSLDQDQDIRPYSYSYPAYRTDQWATVYALDTLAPVQADTLAQQRTRTQVNQKQLWPCDVVHTSGNGSNLFDPVTFSMVRIILPAIQNLTTAHEIEVAPYTYQIKEVFTANGFMSVTAIRKKSA